MATNRRGTLAKPAPGPLGIFYKRIPALAQQRARWRAADQRRADASRIWESKQRALAALNAQRERDRGLAMRERLTRERLEREITADQQRIRAEFSRRMREYETKIRDRQVTKTFAYKQIANQLRSMGAGRYNEFSNAINMLEAPAEASQRQRKRDRQGLGRALDWGEKGLRLLGEPIERVTLRPLSAVNRLDIIRGPDQGYAADAWDTARALFGAWGGQRFIKDQTVRRALDETATPEQREQLVRDGELESPGQYFARGNARLTLNALAGLGVDSARKEKERQRREYEQTGDFRKFGMANFGQPILQAPGTGFAYNNTPTAKATDIFIQLALDPLLALGKVGKLGKIEDAAQAERVLARAGAGADNLLWQIAERSRTAAAMPGGPELGDALELGRMVPMLRGREAAELRAALVARSARPAVRYVEQLVGGRANLNSRAFALALGDDTARVTAAQAARGKLIRDAAELVRKLQTEGMTTETRVGLLRISLGRTWKPDVGLLRAGVALAAGRSGNLGAMFREVQALPGARAGAAGRTLRGRAGLALRGRQAERLLEYRGNPAEGGPTQWAGKLLDARELRQTRKQVATVYARGGLTAVTSRAIRDLRGMGESPVADSLRSQLRVAIVLPKDQRASRVKEVARSAANAAKLAQVDPDRLNQTFLAEVDRFAWLTGTKPRPVYNPWTRAWLALARGFNQVTPADVSAYLPEERSAGMRNWVLGMGGTQAEADQAYNLMVAPMGAERTVSRAKEIQEQMTKVTLARLGVPDSAIPRLWEQISESMDRFMRDQGSWLIRADERTAVARAAAQKRAYSTTGKLDPQVVTQNEYIVKLIDPVELRRFANEWRASQGERLAQLARAGDVVFSTLLYNPLMAWHRLWKTAALVLAPIRYNLRISMDERARLFTEYGFKSALLPPGPVVWRLNAGKLDDAAGVRFATGMAEVGMGGVPLHLMPRGLVETIGHGVVKRGTDGFVENGWHIHTFQVSPESDMLQAVLIAAVHNPDVDAVQSIMTTARSMLTRSWDGREYLARALRTNPRYKNVNDVLNGTLRWLEEVLPNQRIAQRRAQGRYSMEWLAKNQEWALPDQVYGDKYTRLWRGDSQEKMSPGKAWRAYMKLSLEAPTAQTARIPMYYAEFNRHWDALVASGIDPFRANEIASREAVRRVDKVLFDSRNRSRAAQRLDLLFPFAQATEEQGLTIARILRERPVEAAKGLRYVTEVYNFGQNEGIIYEDDYGNASMRVPFAPELSRAFARILPSWVPWAGDFKQAADDLDWDFQLKNLLFMNDIFSLVPRPGGVVSGLSLGVLANRNPDLIPDTPWLRDYLFGYGANMTLVPRPELARLYIGLTGDTHFILEPFAGLGLGMPEMRELPLEAQRDRMVNEVAAQMYLEAIRDGREPPSAEQIANATRGHMLFYSILGAVLPAAPNYRGASQDEYQKTRDAFTAVNLGEFDQDEFLRKHPEYLGYIIKAQTDLVRNRYTDPATGVVDVEGIKRDHPQYWQYWRQKGEWSDDPGDQMRRRIIGAQDYLNPQEWVKAVEQAKENQKAFSELNSIYAGMDASRQQWAIAQWEKKYGGPLQAQGIRYRNALRDRRYAFIMGNYAGPVRDRMLKEWRYEYNVSVQTERDTQLQYLAYGGKELQDNPWIFARNPIDIEREWQQDGNGRSAVTYAKEELSPAEQIRFVGYLAYSAPDVDAYNELMDHSSAVWREFGDKLRKAKDYQLYQDIEERTEVWFRQRVGSAYDEIGRLYEQVDHLDDKVDEALKRALALSDRAKSGVWVDGLGEAWARYRALKDQKSRLFASVKGIKNSLYQKYPRLTSMDDELRYTFAMFDPEKRKLAWEQGVDALGFDWMRPPEEQQYYNMPVRIQKDYVQDLLERLTLDKRNWRTERGNSRLKWEYLTDFQRELLERTLDDSQLELIRRTDAEVDRQGGGKRWKKWRNRKGYSGSGKWSIDGLELGQGFGEIVFAMEQMQMFDRRDEVFQTKPLGRFAPYQTTVIEGKTGFSNRIDYLNEQVWDKRARKWRKEFFWSKKFIIAQPDSSSIAAVDTRTGWVKDRTTGVWMPSQAWQNDPRLYQWLNRTERGKKPAPWQLIRQLQQIRNNPALRRDLIRRNPALQEWVSLGPLQQMPPSLAAIVVNINVKYGRWEDWYGQGVKSWDELADIGFAKNLIRKYNRRKGAQPREYQLWYNMPTGKAKFDYFKKYPQIERWIQAGPMANMPEQYREVVRDIMTRYGLWEKQVDPLGQLISQYYETPEYAKDDFLAKHPEITQYWRAIRTGRERILFDKSQAYFALKDPAARKEFMTLHPELQEYFASQREKQYERFLNKVASYLGSNPDLFKSYLSNQTALIKQLVDMYGRRPLVATPVTVGASRQLTGRMVRADRTAGERMPSPGF